MKKILLGLVVLSLLVGCSDDDEPNKNAQGMWEGTTNDTILPHGTFVVPTTYNLVQTTNGEVSGTYVETFDPSVGFDPDTGTFIGSNSNGSISGSMFDTRAGFCDRNLVGTVSGNSFTGSFTAIHCSEQWFGDFSLTRQ